MDPSIIASVEFGEFIDSAKLSGKNLIVSSPGFTDKLSVFLNPQLL